MSPGSETPPTSGLLLGQQTVQLTPGEAVVMQGLNSIRILLEAQLRLTLGSSWEDVQRDMGIKLDPEVNIKWGRIAEGADGG